MLLPTLNTAKNSHNFALNNLYKILNNHNNCTHSTKERKKRTQCFLAFIPTTMSSRDTKKNEFLFHFQADIVDIAHNVWYR